MNKFKSRFLNHNMLAIVKIIQKFIVSILFLITHSQLLAARSMHRPEDHGMPELSVSWAHKPSKRYSIKDSHIEEYPLFKIFDESHFNQHLLPQKSIAYRNNKEMCVDTKILNTKLEKLLKEVLKRKRTYSDFIVISSKNFNRRKALGMLVLRFKEYPFIFKLYIETPQSFVNPFGKGLDNIWFFPMGGGINRHVAGFTRLKNLELIHEKLAQSEDLSKIFDTPRKWHWLPQKSIWLNLEGKNIGAHTIINAKIPAVYGIIADAIDGHNDLSIFNSEHTSMILGLTNYLNHFIDSHIDNFMIEENTKKIVIIDTEHFPTVVGIKEKITFNNYFEWFCFLAGKCAKDWFFRTKRDRIAAQTAPRQFALT